MTPDPVTNVITELVDTYCAAWNDADPARRLALLRSVWDRHGTYTDPTIHLTSAEELSDHIGRVLTRFPDTRILRTSAVDSHHGILRFAFRRAAPDGQTLRDGLDFGEVGVDGRLRRIVGFFGPLVETANRS